MNEKIRREGFKVLKNKDFEEKLEEAKVEKKVEDEVTVSMYGAQGDGKKAEIVGEDAALAALSNLLAWVDAAKENPDLQVVLLVAPSGQISIQPKDICEAVLSSMGDYMEVDFIFHARLMVRYDENDLLYLRGEHYLTGMFEVLEIDDEGCECGIDEFTIRTVLDYFKECKTEIVVDGERIPALRLD